MIENLRFSSFDFISWSCIHVAIESYQVNVCGVIVNCGGKVLSLNLYLRVVLIDLEGFKSSLLVPLQTRALSSDYNLAAFFLMRKLVFECQ